MKGPLDLFTSIHVHGLAYDANGESSPLTLDRSISFPSPTWTCGNPGEPFFKSLPSRALPTQGYTLEARISPRKSDIISMTTGKSEDGFLGDGRSSFVYSLDIIAIRPSGPTSDEDPLPLDDPIFKKLPPLCIKVAKPTYSRSLAREAWFYEKLDESQLTGVVTPHSYGLFCGGPHNRAPKPQSSGIDRMNSFGCLELNIPMYDVVLDQHFAANPRGASLLPEETGRYKCLDDDQSSYGSSPWFLFRETKDTINPTVLLLEQLPSERKADCENDLDDLYESFDDVSDEKILHCDRRGPNMLKAPTTAKVCPKHGRPHRWFYIDWEDALVAHSEWALRNIRFCRKEFDGYDDSE